MGTSSARRGPGTTAWRMAKGAATRYLSPEGAAPVEARELVRRYVAAWRETSIAQGQELLAEFRLTRKAAQSLGEFGDILAQSGLAAALEVWGLADNAQASAEVVVAGLTSAWLEDQDGLEAAVARTALAACLGGILTADSFSIPEVNGPSLVSSFLAMVLSRRLAFDLGESLEAAASHCEEYQRGLRRLADEVNDATPEAPAAPPGSGQWQGLAGWLWVTRVLEKILQRFEDSSS